MSVPCHLEKRIRSLIAALLVASLIAFPFPAAKADTAPSTYSRPKAAAVQVSPRLGAAAKGSASLFHRDVCNLRRSGVRHLRAGTGIVPRERNLPSDPKLLLDPRSPPRSDTPPRPEHPARQVVAITGCRGSYLAGLAPRRSRPRCKTKRAHRTRRWPRQAPEFPTATAGVRFRCKGIREAAGLW